MRLGKRLAMALALLSALAAWPPPDASARLPEPVAKALAQAGIPESAAAFYVHEIGAARPLLAAGAERAVNPASTIKLLTTYAALELLGPAYTWPTEAYTTGTLKDGVLAGDLVLKGQGDPSLTLENFWLLLRNLRGRGLRDIRGDLVLDRGYFAAAEHDPARFDDQPTRPYNTGPDALLVNFKAVRLQFIPEPETRAVRIVARAGAAAGADRQQPRARRWPRAATGSAASSTKRRATRRRRGSRSTAATRRAAARTSAITACSATASTLAALFRELWRELGGTFTGSVRDGAARRTRGS